MGLLLWDGDRKSEIGGRRSEVGARGWEVENQSSGGMDVWLYEMYGCMATSNQ